MAAAAGASLPHEPLPAHIDLLPRLRIHGADEATMSSRYVAFDGDVIEAWALRQLAALTDAQHDVQQQLAAVVAAGGHDVPAARASPMAVALASQLRSLEAAERLLMRDMQTAASAPPLPERIEFPIDFLEHSPDSIVDVYRACGSQQLFLHPMVVRMLQEDAAAHGRAVPAVVSCDVDDIECVTQTEELRKHRSFAHVPLGANFQIAFADLRPTMARHVARQFDHAIEERRIKIRRYLLREAKQVAKLEEQGKFVENARKRNHADLYQQFGLRTDDTSTSMLNDDEIARRNSSAFVPLASASTGAGSSAAEPAARTAGPAFDAAVAQWHDAMPSLDALGAAPGPVLPRAGAASASGFIALSAPTAAQATTPAVAAPALFPSSQPVSRWATGGGGQALFSAPAPVPAPAASSWAKGATSKPLYSAVAPPGRSQQDPSKQQRGS